MPIPNNALIKNQRMSKKLLKVIKEFISYTTDLEKDFKVFDRPILLRGRPLPCGHILAFSSESPHKKKGQPKLNLFLI